MTFATSTLTETDSRTSPSPYSRRTHRETKTMNRDFLPSGAAASIAASAFPVSALSALLLFLAGFSASTCCVSAFRFVRLLFFAAFSTLSPPLLTVVAPAAGAGFFLVSGADMRIRGFGSDGKTAAVACEL